MPIHLRQSKSTAIGRGLKRRCPACGHGRAFDWSLLAGRGVARPWMLAGGLTPATVARAVAESGARAVDVSSGVESAPGRKDPAAMRAFIAAAGEAGEA